MKQVIKSGDNTIFQRRDGRYAVKGADKKWLNGDEKIAILLAEELIKLPESKPAEPEPEAEPEAAAEEETSEE